MFSLICAWINGWVSNREAGDLGPHRAHYDVTLMSKRFSTSRTPDHIHVCHIYAWLKWISIGPCNGLKPNRRQTHYLNHRWLIFDCNFKKNLQRHFEWIKKTCKQIHLHICRMHSGLSVWRPYKWFVTWMHQPCHHVLGCLFSYTYILQPSHTVAWTKLLSLACRRYMLDIHFCGRKFADLDRVFSEVCS